MPALSELLSKTSLDVALNRMFCSGGPKDRTAYALLMNFNRVVDILIEEYETARRSMIQVTEETGAVPLSALLSAIGHFETCITTTLRAIRFAQRLRSRSRGAVVPPKLSVLSGTVEDRIRNMRNAIEHLENQIARDDWKPGQPYCLMAYEDRIGLGDDAIRYVELAQWIRDLHDLAMDTAQFKDR